MRDLTGQAGQGPDEELLTACEAFHRIHAEMKDPRRGDTDADDDALGVVVGRWYDALDAAVGIPARTAAGQQAKLRTVYTALSDAMKDEPLFGVSGRLPRSRSWGRANRRRPGTARGGSRAYGRANRRAGRAG